MTSRALSVSFLFAALAAGVSCAHATDQTAWRLFISDHADAKVTAMDSLTGRVIDTFALNGPASLHRTTSGQTIFAVQGKANIVATIASGIGFDDHGDHGDIEVSEPRLLNVDVAGRKPSHFVEHHGDIALFFDGEGTARTLTEKDVLQGKAGYAEFRTDAPHHGVAVAYGGHVLLSEPNKEKPDELPVGIRVVDRAGKQVGDIHGCPDLHGEASSGDILAIACKTGLLIVTSDNGAPSIKHLPYPDSLPDRKSTTLIGGKGLQYFVGNYGADRVVLIDPTADKEPFRLIQLPVRRVHFAVDPVRSRFAYVLTEDGQLHKIDAVAGKIVGALKLTDPYSMDGHWSDPRPRIAVAGDEVVVTDPLKGKLYVVKAESFAKDREIPIDGKPYTIVAVGGSGQKHETE